MPENIQGGTPGAAGVIGQVQPPKTPAQPAPVPGQPQPTQPEVKPATQAPAPVETAQQKAEKDYAAQIKAQTGTSFGQVGTEKITSETPEVKALVAKGLTVDAAIGTVVGMKDQQAKADSAKKAQEDAKKAEEVTTPGEPKPEDTTLNGQDPYQGIKDQFAQADKDAEKEFNDMNSLLESQKKSNDDQLNSTISGIQAKYGKLKEEMKVINGNRQNGLEIMGIRAGRQRYAPEIQSGIMGAEEREGLARLADLTSQEQTEIAAAKAAAESKNFALLNAQLENQSNLRKQKLDTLKELTSLATKREDDLRQEAQFTKNYNLQVAQMARQDKQDVQAQVKDQRDYIKDQYTLFGSKAFDGISDEDLHGMEADAGLPYGSLTANKATLKEMEKLSSEKSITVGSEQTVINPTTGEIIFQAPESRSKQQDRDRAEVQQLISSGAMAEMPDSELKRLSQSGVQSYESLKAIKDAQNAKLNAQSRKDSAAEERANRSLEIATSKYNLEVDKFNQDKKVADKKSTAAVASEGQLINASTGEPAKGVSVAYQDAVSSYTNLIDNDVPQALSLLKKVKTGPLENIAIQAKLKTGQNLTPAENQFLTLTGDMLSRLGQARSGAALSEGEVARLKALLPDMGKTNQKNIDDTKQFNKMIEQQMTNSMKTRGLEIAGRTELAVNINKAIGTGATPDKIVDKLKTYKNGQYRQDINDLQSLGYSGQDVLDFLKSQEVKKKSSTVKASIEKKYAAGEWGGQCGDFAHKIADFPSVGDSKASKIASVEKYGIPASEWKNSPKVGDVVITGENKTYGHVAVVNEVLPGGKVKLSESNFYQKSLGKEKVSHTRILDVNSKKIYGAIPSKLKV